MTLNRPTSSAQVVGVEAISGAAFCIACGRSLAQERSDQTGDASSEAGTSVAGSEPNAGPTGQQDPAPVVQSERASKMRIGAKQIMLILVAVFALFFVVLLISGVFSDSSGTGASSSGAQSKSWKDGYASGVQYAEEAVRYGDVYNGENALVPCNWETLTAQTKPQSSRSFSEDNMPPGDNRSEFAPGCLRGFLETLHQDGVTYR